MAKKTSAKSKGYRKSVQKKPYLTKKDIIITAAVVAAIILVVVLFNIFYDDGSLKVKDGVVQTSENSLVLNTGSANNPVYYKIGQLTDIDGYTLTTNYKSTDANVLEYVYYPEGESDIDLISVNPYAYDASLFSAAAEQTYASDSTMASSELQTIEDDGHTVSYLTFSVLEQEETEEEAATEEASETETTEETTEAAAEEEVVYVQALHAYVSVDTDQCIYILVRNDVESPDQYVDDSVLVEALNQVLAVLSYETK